MALTIHSNDPRAKQLTGGSRHRGTDMSHDVDEIVFDDKGEVYRVGRGATNPLVTYQAFYNASGVLCYVYPNATADGIIVTTVKP